MGPLWVWLSLAKSKYSQLFFRQLCLQKDLNWANWMSMDETECERFAEIAFLGTSTFQLRNSQKSTPKRKIFLYPHSMFEIRFYCEQVTGYFLEGSDALRHPLVALKFNFVISMNANARTRTQNPSSHSPSFSTHRIIKLTSSLPLITSTSSQLNITCRRKPFLCSSLPT